MNGYLSGGGTKASSFSFGILAGLSDHGMLDRADYVSTVSGGGYAAYFYYAHHLFPLLRKNGRVTPTTADLYRDCVDLPPKYLATDEVIRSIKSVNHCDRLTLPNVFDPDPDPLTFAELKTGLLQLNAHPESRLPFWIINATAPKYRSAFGWIAKSRADVTNSDMFEMTAVSHGSGRYGYVSAPVSIYEMSVLDAVAASAAFFDSNQLVYQNRAGKFVVGALQHTFNLDWGYDIPNYNVSTFRRNVHRMLPIGLYYLDGFVASKFAIDKTSAEARDRIRSSYIRIIDGGNSENLGVYSLIKRQTRTILISDAAQDQKGLLGDICGLKARLQYVSDNSLPKYLYIPGLKNFEQHCKEGEESEGYSVHDWPAAHPVLLGCIRMAAASDPDLESCQGLSEEETRLFIAKPAINMKQFASTQFDFKQRKVSACLTRGVLAQETKDLLNCDSAIFLSANIGVEDKAPNSCPLFPQHATARMTANSSTTLFVAYRELGRQHIGAIAELMKSTIDGRDDGKRKFAELAMKQRGAVAQGRVTCPELAARNDPAPDVVRNDKAPFQSRQ